VYDSVLKSNVQQTYSTISTAPPFTASVQGYASPEASRINLQAQDLSSASTNMVNSQMISSSSGSPVMINQSAVSTMPSQIMIGQNTMGPIVIGSNSGQMNSQYIQGLANNQIITLTSPVPNCSSGGGQITTLDNCQIISVSSNHSLVSSGINGDGSHGMNHSRLLTLAPASGNPLQINPSINNNNNSTITTEISIHPENLSLKPANVNNCIINAPQDFLLKPVDVVSSQDQQHVVVTGGGAGTAMAKEDILASATHQLIHGYPPLLLEDDEEEGEDDYEVTTYI
jgi:hypothetical protein